MTFGGKPCKKMLRALAHVRQNKITSNDRIATYSVLLQYMWTSAIKYNFSASLCHSVIDCKWSRRRSSPVVLFHFILLCRACASALNIVSGCRRHASDAHEEIHCSRRATSSACEMLATKQCIMQTKPRVVRVDSK